MKKLVSCIAIALCAAVLAGYGDKSSSSGSTSSKSAPAVDPKSPEAVAVKFAEATLVKADMAAAKKLVTKKAQSLFEALEAAMKEEGEDTKKAAEKSGVKISVKKDKDAVKIDGDKATVVIVLSAKDEETGKEESAEEPVKLVKEDGEWKVEMEF